MNVTAYQQKKKNEETKTGMKKAEERKRQSTNFRKTVCCPTAVVQGVARQKNGSRGVPVVTGALGKTNSYFDPTQTGSGPHHHVEAAVDWCSHYAIASVNFGATAHLGIDQRFL